MVSIYINEKYYNKIIIKIYLIYHIPPFNHKRSGSVALSFYDGKNT